MWQTMCTVGTFKADVAHKIILKNLTNIKNATSPKKILNQKNTKKKKKNKINQAKNIHYIPEKIR